jgi:hypothetical protein
LWALISTKLEFVEKIKVVFILMTLIVDREISVVKLGVEFGISWGSHRPVWNGFWRRKVLLGTAAIKPRTQTA